MGEEAPSSPNVQERRCSELSQTGRGHSIIGRCVSRRTQLRFATHRSALQLHSSNRREAHCVNCLHSVCYGLQESRAGFSGSTYHVAAESTGRDRGRHESGSWLVAGVGR